MLNEPLGWLSATLGFVSGAWIGMRFDKADWLGGYNALRRRMIRLGHIALVALGALNVLFAQRAAHLSLTPQLTSVASTALLIGCFSMPACCFLHAWRPVFKPLFAIPVTALITGGCLLVRGSWPS